MEQSEVSEHHLWMCGAVFRPDAAFCGMRLPRARQATSRRHAAASRELGFRHHCYILFYIQSIILNSKGWFSWLSQSRKLERFGSEPEIFIVRQEISLSTFLSLSLF